MTALTDDEVVQIAREAVITDGGLSGIDADVLRSGELDDSDPTIYGSLLGARAVASKLSGGACEPVAPVAYQQFKDGKWVECSEFVAKGWSNELSPGTRALYATPPVEPAVVPARCGTCGETIKPDAMFGTTCSCAPYAPVPAPVADDLVERVRSAVLFLANTASGMDLVQWNKISNDLLEAAARITTDAAVIAGKDAEIAHWKANHAEMVARNAVLRDRPDLPAERLASYQAQEARITDLQAEVGRLREELSDLVDAVQAVHAAQGRQVVDRAALETACEVIKTGGCNVQN